MKSLWRNAEQGTSAQTAETSYMLTIYANLSSKGFSASVSSKAPGVPSFLPLIFVAFVASAPCNPTRVSGAMCTVGLLQNGKTEDMLIEKGVA